MSRFLKLIFDAPEAGQVPPPLTVGTYLFAFHMPKETKDWFDVQEVEVVKGQPKEEVPED